MIRKNVGNISGFLQYNRKAIVCQGGAENLSIFRSWWQGPTFMEKPIDSPAK